MTQDRSGRALREAALSASPTEPVPVSSLTGDDQPRFDNAKFVRVLSQMNYEITKVVAGLAYGAWNPAFCSADASDHALEVFGEIKARIAHWEQHIAHGAPND